jgi:hypothetical protein
MNMPFVRKKLKQISPRYIMNVAIRSPDSWFLYYYRGPGRITYDPKWFPRKPSKPDGPVGVQLDRLKEEERDQLSYCAFGESSKSFFLRSTDRKKEWHPRLSKHVPTELLDAYQDEFKRGCPRAVTFGKGRTWILYGKASFKWSRHGLPQRLQIALRKGKEERWTVNVCVLSFISIICTAAQLTQMPQKAVLNRNNREEYVLVFNEGPVYFSFHQDFLTPFKMIIEEWSSGMRSSGRYPDHKATFPSENRDDNEDQGDSDSASSESATDDSGDDGNNMSRQNRRTAKEKNRPETSSTSNASAPEASGSSQRPRADSDDGGIIVNPVSPPPPPHPPLSSTPQTPFVTASPSTERVPIQQPSQPAGPVMQEPGPDEQPGPPRYTADPPRNRGHNRIQSFKDGVREGVRGLFT